MPSPSGMGKPSSTHTHPPKPHAFSTLDSAPSTLEGGSAGLANWPLLVGKKRQQG